MSEFAHLASLPELTADQKKYHDEVSEMFGPDTGADARRLKAQEATKIREKEVANFGSDSAAEREAAEAEFDKDFKYKKNQAVRFSMDGIIVNGTIVSRSKSFMHPFGPKYIVEYDNGGVPVSIVIPEDTIIGVVEGGGKNRRISKKHQKSKHRKSKHRKSKHRKSKHRKSRK
jgi:hypothetical protein